MTETVSAGKPARDWIKYALVASLGVNVLVVGLMVGAVLRDGSGRGRPDRAAISLGLRPYYRALDKAERRDLRQTIKDNPSEFRAKRGKFAKHLKNLSIALKAEPFDLQAVANVLAAQADVVSVNIAFGQKILLERIVAMSPQQRALFAERLVNPRRNARARPIKPRKN